MSAFSFGMIFSMAMMSGLGAAAPVKYIANDAECRMPYANFKYSYMDSLIRSTPKPAAAVFLKTSSNDMDVVKAQFYLWFVYKNPDLSADFFSRVNLLKIIARNKDALNSILWLMSRKGGYFSSQSEKDRLSAEKTLANWRSSYDKENPERSLILDIYANDNFDIKELSKRRGRDKDTDVDLLLQMGVVNQNYGNNLEALFYYTEVSEMGYRAGLVGASLLLPQLGGAGCVQRAGYYARLSGALGKSTWVEGEKSKGGDEEIY